MITHDFKNSFPQSTIIEWNNLDSNIRNSESLALFKKNVYWLSQDILQIVPFIVSTLKV